MELIEDDQLLEAALSLLDEYNDDNNARTQEVAHEKRTATKTKKKRNYNPNRARAAQYKELQELRDQVPMLERRLKMLQLEIENTDPSTMTVGKQQTMELWKKMAMYQRQTRLSSEEENRRLRQLIQEHNEITTRNIQQLLQTRQGHVESSGIVRDDTIVESFGEEHRFGKVLLDFKVKQIVRRYEVAGRVVVAWRAILSPDKFKGESLGGVQFEEKGALVVEPYEDQLLGSNQAASIVHTWQTITGDINDIAAEGDQKKLVQDMTEFVLNGSKALQFPALELRRVNVRPPGQDDLVGLHVSPEYLLDLEVGHPLGCIDLHAEALPDRVVLHDLAGVVYPPLSAVREAVLVVVERVRQALPRRVRRRVEVERQRFVSKNANTLPLPGVHPIKHPRRLLIHVVHAHLELLKDVLKLPHSDPPGHARVERALQHLAQLLLVLERALEAAVLALGGQALVQLARRQLLPHARERRVRCSSSSGSTSSIHGAAAAARAARAPPARR
ncbi:hypothetical protein ON010_g16975 [Phytophthora cinnamomi]|nr:hypothetical protein ON010_g16975 [Phytophthora cinnamomi]